MKPRSANRVPDSVWKLFRDIQFVLDRAPDKRFSDTLYLGSAKIDRRIATMSFSPNCHMVCRALAKVFPVKVCDGVVCSSEAQEGLEKGGYDHSWLLPISGPEGIIIDPCPIGVVSGPCLVCVDTDTLRYAHCVSWFVIDRDKQLQARINYLANMFRRIGTEAHLETLVA